MSDGPRGLLLQLHPHPWRDRFGDEFAALLADTPLTVAAVADVVRHAAGLQLAQAFRTLGTGAAAVVQTEIWVRVTMVILALAAAVAALTAGFTAGHALSLRASGPPSAGSLAAPRGQILVTGDPSETAPPAGQVGQINGTLQRIGPVG
ncbi:MAG: hypothetical protein ACRDJU_07980 [Actinomycetota bacterium]